MIQRIQSVFLALGAISSFGLFGTDAAETEVPVTGSEVFADAQYDVYDSLLLTGGVLAAGLLLLIAIFLFTNRRLQVVLCNVAMLITLAYAIYGGVVWYTDSAAAQAQVDFGALLPILTILFAALAARYVRKDEKLVRSADRLR